jgi:hypothetical protein
LTTAYLVAQTKANRSREKSDKLRAVEGGLHQLQAKDRQIGEQIMKNVEPRNQLDAIKLERYCRPKPAGG